MDPVSRYLHDTTPLPPATQQALARFQQLECGRLRLGLPDGQTLDWRGALPGPEAELTLSDQQAMLGLAHTGLASLPAGFAAGHWHSRDLVRLLYLFCLNPLLFPPPLPQTPGFWGRLRNLRHRMQPAATSAAAALPSPPDAAFYENFLGAALDDGPGLFQTDADTALLAQASAREALLKALGDVRTSDSLLEIGGGWGALSEMLCRSGARLVVQSGQPSLARALHARLSGLALKQPVTVKAVPLLQLQGRYERIIWVLRPSEPLPVATEAAWAAVFRHLKSLLKQGGRLVIQTATVAPGTAAGLPPVLFPADAPPAHDAFLAAARNAYLDPSAILPFGADAARLYGMWRLALAATLHVDTAAANQTATRRWLYRLAALEAAHLAGTLATTQYAFVHRV
jgi:cyclopropane-fatty-acyl-phospholipid synthase